MFKDLRKKASVIRPNKFTNALIEYLSTELKDNNVKYRKKVSYIDIKIDSPIDNKYSNLIIDCFNGKIYLRGTSVNDKQVLKMRRFYLGDRESDALYCAKGAYQQIARYLKKINNENTSEIKTAKIDLRKKLKRTAISLIDCGNTNNYVDLRGRLLTSRRKLTDMRLKNKTAKVDLRKNVKVAFGRDYAITIVDGKIYKGDTHGECVTQCLNEMGIEGIEFYDRIDLRENLGFNFYSQFAAAHVIGNKIYLDKLSLENITYEQAIQILKNNFADYEIYDYDTREKVAIYLDKNNRDSAILYFNGEVFEGDDHWTMMERYVNSSGKINKNDYKSDNDYERALSEEFDSNSYATGSKLDDKIYFESDFLNNCTEEDILSACKSQFPNCEIVFHEHDLESFKDYINEYADPDYLNKMVGDKNIKRLKRLASEDYLSIDWDQIDKDNKEIEDYIKANGWTQAGVGMWINEQYPTVECIDTMTDQIVLYGKHNAKNHDGISVISNDTVAIKTLDGLKYVLNTL